MVSADKDEEEKIQEQSSNNAVQKVEVGIGATQMQQGLQSRVLAVTRKTSDKMEEETGVEPSMTEEDMKRYVNEVLKEIRTPRSNH
jgi:hypothetical protein